MAEHPTRLTSIAALDPAADVTGEVLAVHVQALRGAADALAALPIPTAESATPPPRSVVGDRDIAAALAEFYDRYRRVAADLAEDHAAAFTHLNHTAEHYQDTETTTAGHLIRAAQLHHPAPNTT